MKSLAKIAAGVLWGLNKGDRKSASGLASCLFQLLTPFCRILKHV
ncbi:hypothetical protein [Microcoleus sp. FACHB-SPT15]|nr:hypothetical protein [Microcoleus sp. FACHB-SPT15]